MSVTATSVSKSFAGSGTGPYTMSPEVVFTATTEIQGTLDGVALTNGVDFTVDVGTQAVTTVASYTAGQTLVFYRVTAQTQDTTLSATETPSGTTVESALDKTVRQVQEAHGKGDRALKVPVGSTGYDIDSAVADGDYLKLNGTTLEGKSTSEVADDIGASASATAAAASAAAAATSESNAATSETNADAAKTAAEAAQTAAETAETNAETAETNAETAETNVNAILTSLTLGVADPEGSVTETAPAIGLATDGTYWIKTSGSGNTGWQEVALRDTNGNLPGDIVFPDAQDTVPTSGASGDALALVDGVLHRANGNTNGTQIVPKRVVRSYSNGDIDDTYDHILSIPIAADLNVVGGDLFFHFKLQNFRDTALTPYVAFREATDSVGTGTKYIIRTGAVLASIMEAWMRVEVFSTYVGNSGGSNDLDCFHTLLSRGTTTVTTGNGANIFEFVTNGVALEMDLFALKTSAGGGSNGNMLIWEASLAQDAD